MASKYWIKLYHDILDDPKMGMMTDRLYRRTIELFLLAGEQDRDGALPDLGTMAWRLRVPVDILLDDLDYLERAGIITRTWGEPDPGAIDADPDGPDPRPVNYLVTNFAKRQAPVSAAERMARYRSRLPVGGDDATGEIPNGYDNVTIGNTDTDTDKITDKITELDKKLSRNITTYQNEIGLVTGYIGEQIKSWSNEVPEDWFTLACQEAAANGKRSWAYVNAILVAWKMAGQPKIKMPNGKSGKAQAGRSQDIEARLKSIKDQGKG